MPFDPREGIFNLDIDRDAHVLGLEILDARRHLPTALLEAVLGQGQVETEHPQGPVLDQIRTVRERWLMRIVSHPPFGEVHLSATETELNRLAELVATGGGSLTCESEPTEPGALAAAEVAQATGPGVHIHVDAARRVLMISGDAGARYILADNLRGMAQTEDGGHLHVDYFPDHPYLAAGSVPLVVDSPHGGMPRRWT